MFHTTVWERIEEAKQQDPLAVEGFVERYRAPLLRYLRRWEVPGIEPEDLVQEVLLALFGRGALARANPARGRFRAYLLGVAKRVAQDALRRQGAEKRGGLRGPGELVESPPAPSPSDEDFDRIWYEHVLRWALEDLARHNPRQREVLRLSFDERLPHAEIATRLGRNVQQVKNDVHRGREHLKKAARVAIEHYASSDAEFEAELATLRRFVGLFA